ncbi:hypothetical protein CK203_029879 [Vitis vinifera]|uniref:Uncharacterized protein n=1 Tax=Vitis vinifera TaxID=29760 RepID=A0A438IDQ6_VITVI|nr:hypothetical protein CK203_029879 [Vitis vinifera]
MGGLVPTEKAEQGAVVFSRNNSMQGSGSPASVAHGIPPFHQDSTRLHPSQYYPGADGMQHHQHAVQPRLTMLEVFFVYSLKKAKIDIFSLSAHLPSLQLVTELPTRRREGQRDGDGSGCVGGVETSDEALLSKLFLSDSGSGKRATRGLGGNGVFACLSKLFEIDAKERQCKTVSGQWEKKKNEGTLRKAPRQNATQTSSKENSSKKEEAGEEREGMKEPTPPMEFAPPPITHEAEVMIEELVNLLLILISSESGHVAGLNHSSTSLAAVAVWRIWLRKCVVNHPESHNPDADAAEAVCATPMEEAGAESQSQPSDDPDLLALVLVTGHLKEASLGEQLRSGLLGRLQDGSKRLKSVAHSAHDAHPRGAKWRWSLRPQPSRVMRSRLEVAPGECHPAVNVEAPIRNKITFSAPSGGILLMTHLAPASSFSYAELEDKLKQIPPGCPASSLSPDVRDGGNAGEWSRAWPTTRSFADCCGLLII